MTTVWSRISASKLTALFRFLMRYVTLLPSCRSHLNVTYRRNKTGAMHKIILLFILGSVICQDVDAEQFAYDSKGKHDPFFSATEILEDDVNYSDLKLEGIILDVGGAHAVINSEIVQVGDSIAGFKVRTIDANRVVLERDEKTFDLLLRREDKEEVRPSGPAEGEEAYEFEVPPVDDEQTAEELKEFMKMSKMKE